MGVTVGLLYDQIRWEEKAIAEMARKRGVEINLVDCKSSFFDVTGPENSFPFGDIVLQRCISYFRNLHSTALLEYKGYIVINSFDVSNTCGNKMLASLALAKSDVPTPSTLLAFTPETALQAMEKIGYPAVLKPVMGSWGRLIAPLKDKETAQAIFEDREYMFPIYHIYYIQEMVNRPPRDIRTFVIGDEVVAGIYRYSFDEMKTNIARGGKAEFCKITDELRELSLKAAEAVGGGILGVDMMETKNGLVVHEINHTVEFQATVQITGVDIPKHIIGYLLRKAKQ
ncbi:MAG: lysine biosynthesis protein LysX [Candidatus Bathyarchaeia archaeon]